MRLANKKSWLCDSLCANIRDVRSSKTSQSAVGLLSIFGNLPEVYFCGKTKRGQRLFVLGIVATFYTKPNGVSQHVKLYMHVLSTPQIQDWGFLHTNNDILRKTLCLDSLPRPGLCCCYFQFTSSFWHTNRVLAFDLAWWLTPKYLVYPSHPFIDLLFGSFCSLPTPILRHVLSFPNHSAIFAHLIA